MRVHVLQHTADVPQGHVVTWCHAQGLYPTFTRFQNGDTLPHAEEIDWLIVLGGSMNVDEEDKHPWLREEKKFIERVLKQGTTTLGLCLGGQLIAQVLGATVLQHTHWEVGLHPITRTDAHHPLIHHWPEQIRAYCWHEDTFEIPRSALHLMTSEGCANQAYAYGDNVMGFQFHPEADEDWIAFCMQKLRLQPKESPFVQNPSLIADHMNTLPEINRVFAQLMQNLRKTVRTDRAISVQI